MLHGIWNAKKVSLCRVMLGMNGFPLVKLPASPVLISKLSAALDNCDYLLAYHTC